MTGTNNNAKGEVMNATEIRTNDLTDEQIRKSVIGYMHYNGDDYGRLNSFQWETVYLAADGFGSINIQWARQQSWDWSHVRDSSPEAFRRMWQLICKMHNMGLLNG